MSKIININNEMNLYKCYLYLIQFAMSDADVLTKNILYNICLQK